MRAIFNDFDNVYSRECLVITGDAAHHLNVVRIKIKEELLLMNGKGSIISGEVQSISKNSIEIKIIKIEVFEPKHELSLAIATPKKDAFEDVLRLSVELGIRHIFPLSSDFSQYNYAPSERIQRLLESALIQSNNPFFPIIHEQQTLKNFLSTHENTLVFFNSQKMLSEKENYSFGPTKTILIGPEGGFSINEVNDILSFSTIEEIHLATAIMRAPTAVASSVGYLLATGDLVK